MNTRFGLPHWHQPTCCNYLSNPWSQSQWSHWFEGCYFPLFTFLFGCSQCEGTKIQCTSKPMSKSWAGLKSQDTQSAFPLKHREALSILMIMSSAIFQQLLLSYSFASISTCKFYLSYFCNASEKPLCKTVHYYQSFKARTIYWKSCLKQKLFHGEMDCFWVHSSH